MYGAVSPNQERKYPMSFTKPKAKPVSVMVRRFTPKQAQKLLDKSEEMANDGTALRNRPVNSHRVHRYSEMMRDGQWKMTGEPIQIHSDGYLLNGQHRLHAMVDAGIELDIVVVENVDDDSFRVMDTGMARRPSDAILDLDVPSKTTVMASARLLVALDAGLSIANSHELRLVTRQDQADFVAANLEWYQNNIARAVKVGTHRIGTTTAWAAFLKLTDSAGAADKGIEFLDGVASGVNLDDGDPRLALRSWLLSQSGTPTPILLGTILRSFNDWVAGRTRKMVRPFNPATQEWPTATVVK